LLNPAGEAVGLPTALAAIRDPNSSGILAVPFDANTRRIIEVLMRGEEVEYGFLGVVLYDEPRNPRGVKVKNVSPGSPAGRAGLSPGDVITAINDRRIEDSDDLFLAIGMQLAGNQARLDIHRPGEARHRVLTVKLAKFYVPGPVISAHRPPARGGLRVDYTSLLSQRGPFLDFGRGPPEGVIIREVLPGGSADKARLQPDKIITQVNGRPVTSPADYYREMEKAGERAELTFLDSEGRPERVTLELK
jgi:serine protease Do